jgi:hypothetical protein
MDLAGPETPSIRLGALTKNQTPPKRADEAGEGSLDNDTEQDQDDSNDGIDEGLRSDEESPQGGE